MDTPPPDTKVQSETLDTVAIMIAKAFYDRYPVLSLKARTDLANEILSALRNEREKCAKVAETVDSAFDVDPILRRKIATAIREGPVTKMPTLIEDIAEVEKQIRAVHEKARLAWLRVMRETEDGSHKSALGLMEICVGGLSRAETAARYARHDLGR